MKDFLFTPGLFPKIKVALDPVEVLKNPTLLMHYYAQVQPLLTDALADARRLMGQLASMADQPFETDADCEKAVTLL